MRLQRFFGYIVVLQVSLACLFSEPAAIRQRMFGGTFIGAIVCEDGIIVGSDSRSTFLDSDGRPIGYVDGTQKVYATSATAVAISGLTSVEGELFNSFVDRNSFLLDRSADEVLFGFSAWLPFKNSTNVLLLSAGFNDGKPMVCARSVVQPQACQPSGFITNKPSPSLKAWLSSQHSSPKAIDAVAALKFAIQESAATDRTVGGPVSVVHLRPGSAPRWIESPPATSWKTVCDLVRDHRAGRIRIVATAAQSELDRYLNSSCPK